ncbi:Nucleoside-triphosphatase, THEP1 type, partial [Cynara cardunculus var. scolymus]
KLYPDDESFPETGNTDSPDELEDDDSESESITMGPVAVAGNVGRLSGKRYDKFDSLAMAAPAKCFLVTGSPGVGKTTLIARVLETLRISNPNLKIQGEIRQGGERVGFEVVTLDGRTAPLASIHSS